MRNSLALAGVALSLGRSTAWAQPPIAVVRAPRPSAGEAAISHAELERTGATTTADVLRALGDVDLQGGGAPGSVGRFTLRGGSPDQALVLLDGVRLTGRTGASVVGGADPNLLPVSMLERVTLLRGPSSALVGPNAVHGALLLSTREPSGPSALTGLAQGGSFGSLRAQLQGHFRRGRSFSVASLTVNRTDGWVPNTEAHLASATFKHGVTLANGGVAFVWVSFFDALTGAPSFGSLFDTDVFDADDRDQRRGVLTAAVWRRTLRDLGRLEATVAAVQSQQVHRNPVGDDRAVGGEDEAIEDRFLDLQARVAWSRPTVTGGGPSAALELQREALDSTRVEPLSALRASLQGRERLDLGRFELDAALRVDADTRFGAEVSPRVALGWQPAPLVRTWLAAGRAFRPPTFAELAWPTIRYARPVGAAVGEQGNPGLTPERSAGLDFGLELGGRGAPWSVDARAFALRYFGLLRWSLGGDNVWQPVNVPEATSLGASVDLRARPWRLLTLTLTGFLQRSFDQEGAALDGRLRHKLVGRVGWEDRQGLRAWVEGLYFDREGVDSAGRPWQGFFVNARLGHRIYRELSVYGMVENLLGTTFETVRGLPTPGTTLWAGLSVDWDED
ncbi:MAG: TonB-dependent receptor [Deltaproteobacteria bacterium]|nr:TonB-dependent receptor [Deltaproteobacteria bacterium]